MFKFTAILFAIVACAAAKPGFVAPVAFSAPLVAPGVVTATSSQFVARNHNGIAVVASAPLAYTSSVVAPVAKYVAHHTPLAYTAPVAAYSSPVAKYVSSAYTAPLTYAAPVAKYVSSPLTYATPVGSHFAYTSAAAPLVL